MDGLRGRHCKYKTATVFLVPVTDTPTMTPFSLMDCHIIPYEDVSAPHACSPAKDLPTSVPSVVEQVREKADLEPKISSLSLRFLDQVPECMA